MAQGRGASPEPVSSRPKLTALAQAALFFLATGVMLLELTTF
jgi:hypothetical protein